MMEFAINFSRNAAELFSSGAIPLDRFKAPDWPELIAEASAYLPVYVHYAINAGAGDSRTTDWPRADEMARQTNTPFINLHLAPRAKDFPGLGDDPHARPVIEAMIADVQKIAAFFGKGRVIAENIPLGNPEERFALACVDPAAIHEVIDRTGVGLLLDLSHARLTAKFLGIDERQYISALPVKHLKELHLTGIQQYEGRLRDHMHLTDQDWDITAWALNQIRAGVWTRPKIVAFEYGGVGGSFEWRSNRAHMAEQVPRLYEMVHAAGKAAG